jgi:hypothetical protein
MLLGNVLDLGVPSDATVTNAKLAQDIISGETDIGGAIADADLFLLDDGAGGTLRKTAASRIKTYAGGSNTPAFEAHRTARQVVSDNTFTKLAAGTEVFDTDGTYDKDTNYRFTPAVVGKYFIYASIGLGSNDNSALATSDIAIYKNGSIYQTHHNDNSLNNPNLHWNHIYGTMDLDGDDYVEIFGLVNTTASSPFFEGIASNTYQSIFGGFKILT